MFGKAVLELITPEVALQAGRFAGKAKMKPVFSSNNWDSNDRLLSQFAAAAYKSKNSRKDIQGHKYFKGLSTREIGIWSSPIRTVVAIKGTSNPHNLKSDIHLILKQPKKAFKGLKKRMDLIIQRFGKGKIILTGHSLGATKAMEIGRVYGLPGVIFNPFVPQLNNKRTFDNIMNTPRIKKWTIRGDPLSNKIIPTGRATVINVKGLITPLQAHTIKSFDKVNKDMIEKRSK